MNSINANRVLKHMENKQNSKEECAFLMSQVIKHTTKLYSSFDIEGLVYKLGCKHKRTTTPESNLDTFVLTSFNHRVDIKFGIVLENLLKDLIEFSDKYEVLPLCKTKYISMNISERVIQYIDKVLNDIDTNTLIVENEETYINILKTIIGLTHKYKNNKVCIYSYDVDLIFKDKLTNHIYFAEIKKGSNQDTTKSRGMVLKYFRTFAYIVNEFSIQDISQITPMLLYYDDDSIDKSKCKGIYTCEKGALTGKMFCNRFIPFSYETIRQSVSSVSELNEAKGIQKVKENIRKVIKKSEKYISNPNCNNLKDFKSFIQSEDNIDTKLKQGSPKFSKV